MTRVPDYVAMAKEASRRWREANGLPPRDLSAHSSLTAPIHNSEVIAQGEEERLARECGATQATEATKECVESVEGVASVTDVTGRLQAAWTPQPHLSRWIPEHAAILFAFLQDHCGAFFTVDDIFRRRGGPREDLEACLDLLVITDLVATLNAPGPLRYGAREPRYLDQYRPGGGPAGPGLFSSGSPA